MQLRLSLSVIKFFFYAQYSFLLESYSGSELSYLFIADDFPPQTSILFGWDCSIDFVERLLKIGTTCSQTIRERGFTKGRYRGLNLIKVC